LNEGIPGPEHFEILKTSVKASDLPDGGILLDVLVMSVDPYLRGGLKNRNPLSGKEGTGSGRRIMSGFVAGKVIASKSDKWVVGDLLGASLPFSTVQIVSAEAMAKTLSWKLTEYLDESQISLGVGAMGMPGSTAYGGLIDVLRPIKGQTIFVSAASGAVGSIVGQIAKHAYNCTVIGSCGGPKKNAYIKERYGFDHAVDYKALPKDHAAGVEALTAKLKECAPKGIDMYFENVGGVHFEAALAALRPRGRIAVCGCISGYNAKESPKNRLSIGQLIYTFQRIEGFVCMPWLSGQKGHFLRDMAAWIGAGKVKPEETFFDGVEQWPAAFQSLFTGKKRGKVVVLTGPPGTCGGGGTADYSSVKQQAAKSYKVYYYPAFSGRAQPLDMMLEAAGAKWSRGSKADGVKDAAVFAVPAVSDGKTTLSQTTAAAAWLGQELGFAPPAGKDFEAMKVALDIADVWSESYKAATSGDKAFTSGRLQNWLKCLEAQFSKVSGEYLFGAAPCYVDFLLANLVDIVLFVYGPTEAITRPSHANVLAAYDGLRRRPKILAYMKSVPVGYESLRYKK